jgi:hypothetical protein
MYVYKKEEENKSDVERVRTICPPVKGGKKINKTFNPDGMSRDEGRTACEALRFSLAVLLPPNIPIYNRFVYRSRERLYKKINYNSL